MTTKELKVMNSARTNKTATTVLLPCLALLAGCFVLMVLHESNGALWAPFVAMPLLQVAITGLVVWGSIAFTQRKKVFTAFAENDIWVEQDGSKPLRKIEQFAVDHCGGNLKQALELAATSPELSRAERNAMSDELMDYERQYILEKCDTSVDNSFAESRQELLTREHIENDLAEASRKYRKTRCAYQVLQAACMNKIYAPSDEGVIDVIKLQFGAAGEYKCTYTEYSMTEIGDQFYIVKLENTNKILLAYSERDWVAAEDLRI